MKVNIFILFIIFSFINSFLLSTLNVNASEIDISDQYTPFPDAQKNSYLPSSQDLSTYNDPDFLFDTPFNPGQNALMAPPDLGGDVEGGGSSGIGRESPIPDSFYLLILLSFLYFIFSVIKNIKKRSV